MRCLPTSLPGFQLRACRLLCGSRTARSRNGIFHGIRDGAQMHTAGIQSTPAPDRAHWKQDGRCTDSVGVLYLPANVRIATRGVKDSLPYLQRDLAPRVLAGEHFAPSGVFGLGRIAYDADGSHALVLYSWRYCGARCAEINIAYFAQRPWRRVGSSCATSGCGRHSALVRRLSGNPALLLRTQLYGDPAAAMYRY